jgi:hypothetical protein
MNVAPLSYFTTHIQTIGYQASPDADGLLTYKLRGSLPEADKHSFRIGWQGSATVYTDWSILGYALLRRPLIALRTFFKI